MKITKQNCHSYGDNHREENPHSLRTSERNPQSFKTRERSPHSLRQVKNERQLIEHGLIQHGRTDFKNSDKCQFKPETRTSNN